MSNTKTSEVMVSNFLEYAEFGWDDNYDGPVWPVGKCLVHHEEHGFWVVSYCGKTLLFGLVARYGESQLAFARREQIQWTVESWSSIRADVNRAQQNERNYDHEPIEALAQDVCMSVDRIAEALSSLRREST